MDDGEMVVVVSVWDELAAEKENLRRALVKMKRPKDGSPVYASALLLLGMEEVIRDIGLDGFRELMPTAVKVAEEPFLN